jgi:hypothetical protein
MLIALSSFSYHHSMLVLWYTLQSFSIGLALRDKPVHACSALAGTRCHVVASKWPGDARANSCEPLVKLLRHMLDELRSTKELRQVF